MFSPEKKLISSPQTLGANEDHQKINDKYKGVFESRNDE
jgi:hypothetical protein